MASSGATRSQPGAVLVDRPITRRARTFVLVAATMLAVCLAVFITLLSLFGWPSVPAWIAAVVSIVMLGPLLLSLQVYAKLYSERYVVTPQAIEITSGILRRDLRKIPFSNVLDITSNASFDRRLFGLGNITVSIANGDTITLEDITDSQTKAETLWNLVHKT
jgi:membrane protein YdbS with pleckstrin-like domain